MNLQTLTLILKTKNPVTEGPEKLRGFFGNRFREYPILHQHAENGTNFYQYPKVQYKIIEGTPVILGIEEGAEILKDISWEIEELILGKATYRIEERQIIERTQEFGCSDKPQQYMFVVPWIALNEKNYESYLQSDPKNRVTLLHRILVGNLLSISKSLGYVVLGQIKVKTKLSPVKVISKGIPLIGFEGGFQTNFMIPEYLGIGKSVSRGFGVARKCNSQ
ncbi:Uncharacterised protein [uncultured archaeon]|nr:Uncharacterised protein [uncultured archaeon]